MKATSQNETLDVDPDNNFDALCQGFDGGNFYGLEYILEDFFQSTVAKSADSNQHSVSIDWFGLNT